MRRTGLLAVLVASALAACSGGGSKAALSDASVDAVTGSRSSAAATTTSAASSSLSVEDEVKAAYLAYWTMIDRIFAAPNPDDPELPTRATEPLLSFVRDNVGTKAALGRSYQRPAGRPNSHRIDSTRVENANATLEDCYVDGSVELDASGAVVDDGISTRRTLATLVRQSDAWKVSGLQFIATSVGVSGCAA